MKSAQKHTITVRGAKVSYWVYHPEKKPTILMVHGFRGNHHGLEDLANLLPQYRIVIPDLPGFGQSEPFTSSSHDVAAYTAFLQAFIDSLDESPIVLLGHSFGSILAAHFAADYPQDVAKLILVNPIASPALQGPRGLLTRLTIAYYWLGEKLPERAGRKWLGHPMIVLTMSALLAKSRDKELRKKIHSNHLRHFSSFQTRAVVAESFKASVNHTAIEKAEKISVPTLLIAGKEDDIAPLRSQYQLSNKIKTSQLVVIPQVGHLIHYEAPISASEAISEFIEEKIPHTENRP